MTIKISLQSLPNEIITDNCVFLCCASFESRSLSVPNVIKDSDFKKVFIIANQDFHENISTNAKKINSFFKEKSELVKTEQHKPLFTADALSRMINNIIGAKINNIIIDITTFTHEMLLILLKLIYLNKKCFKKITCIYTSAKNYSVGDKDNKIWLSKGCKEVRSVLGYPGKIIPGKPISLYVLVGFEHERASRMISDMDPEKIIMGKGMSDQITHEKHKMPMIYFYGLVQDMVSSRGNTEEFEFSCIDPVKTSEIITNLCESNKDNNNIIVPLNTKISTVGVALAAFKNENIQVCYAEPEHYNYERYSEPDDYVRLFNIFESD